MFLYNNTLYKEDNSASNFISNLIIPSCFHSCNCLCLLDVVTNPFYGWNCTA